MLTSRWKWVQLTGRLARRRDEQGIFVTVIPEKQSIRGDFITVDMVPDTVILDQLLPVRRRSSMRLKLLCHLEIASTAEFTIPSRSMIPMVNFLLTTQQIQFCTFSVKSTSVI